MKFVVIDVLNVPIMVKPMLKLQVLTVYLVPLTEPCFHSVNVQKDIGIIILKKNQIVDLVMLHVLVVLNLVMTVGNVKPTSSYSETTVIQNVIMQPLATIVTGEILLTEFAKIVTQPV